MRTPVSLAFLVASGLFGGLCLTAPMVSDCNGQETRPLQASPTGKFTPAQLTERAQRRRAVEAVIWGMPAVNFDLLYQSMVKVGGSFNQVVFWSRLPSWKNQTLTPNPDTIYVFPFFSTRDVGPVVLEIPPAEGGSITGSIMDAWQCALEDVGPAGVDKGRGGKYLILPPGYKAQIPDGYIVLPSDTFQGYAVLRSNLKGGSDEDVARAVAYGKRVKLYPLAKALEPPSTTFVDAIDAIYDNIIPYDLRYFESLNRFVQAEPWLDRDKAMIDMLKSIGIERGKPFEPNAKLKGILEDAAHEAHAALDVAYESVFTPPFNEGSHWALPASPEVVAGMPTFFSKPDSYPIDGRGLTYSMAYFSAKHLGTGQFYLMTIKDKDGRPFDGRATYRLSVPANVPVRLYWSATIYDRATHAFIRDVPRFSRSSLSPDLRKNVDGSVDVYFGPKAPEGEESNWIPTNPKGQFEVLFRFYGPEKPLFDKTWKLPDVMRRSTGDAVTVTAENFARAESDLYFGGVAKDRGFGKFHHNRELTPLDRQTVIRMNRDTLYSAAVFDLDAGPVTVILPDSGKRFMSMQVIDEDHFTPAVHYGGGSHTLDRKTIGTRYVLTAIRTLIDPADPKDLETVHNLQDAIKVEQKDPGKFEVPNWDQASQQKTRAALLTLGSTLPDSRRMFGARGRVDPVRHLVGSAMAWGGNPEEDAIYLNVTPTKNDGESVYQLRVKDVPVDGFWSISVYDAAGYFKPNAANAYTLNNFTAKKKADGSITVTFGGDGSAENSLPISPGWNYLVRLYRPRKEILDGTWKFPEAKPAE